MKNNTTKYAFYEWYKKADDMNDNMFNEHKGK